jgi:3-hydroxyisobutyrate dehydrogenase-like beta-hydroxyacid dehydrogenase
MNEGIKQYTIEEAYIDNTLIKMYEKGKLVDKEIVSNWKLSVYLERLIDEGYQRAFDVKEYEKAVQRAKEALMQAEIELEMARANRLYTEEELV